MITEVKQIDLADGVKLHCEIVETGSPVWLIITHGLGEHKSRHKYFFEQYSQYFNILTYDLRGHGLSTGKRGYIEQFDHYIDDLESVITFLKEKYSMERFVLFGHSMGGLITASYMQKKAKFNPYPEKVFLSAPAVAAPGLMGGLFQMSPLSMTGGLANLPFSVPIKGILDIKKLSHDKRIYEAYVADELNVLKVHTRTLLQLINECREVFSKPLRIECDLYVAIGTGDVLVNPKACIEYFKMVEKSAKLMINQDAYHEMHNEIERYRAPYFDFLKESLMTSFYS